MLTLSTGRTGSPREKSQLSEHYGKILRGSEITNSNTPRPTQPSLQGAFMEYEAVCSGDLRMTLLY